MSNRWGIPKEVELIVRQRDVECVYCGVKFSNNKMIYKNRPSWEHIINDIRINGIDNIALCCISCNASKGTKSLQEWLKSSYCKRNNISAQSVADVVRKALFNDPALLK
ncbi:HNH endonuclease signature motif containing protein [Saccharicrinis sp. FJH54]|uniref:HNH endonuclease signature motif containing protein n=1 Tax=Saccharicrinis sp. FJH54 TaxID=3344665 RepID=UPI0035D44D49